MFRIFRFVPFQEALLTTGKSSLS